MGRSDAKSALDNAPLRWAANPRKPQEPAPEAPAPSDQLRGQLQSVPKATGVYIFQDGQGQALYVGKANNLYERVRHYLAGQDERARVAWMLAQATAVRVLTTETEREALVLEASLIRHLQPQYNVAGRWLPKGWYLTLDSRHPWPRLQRLRQPPEGSGRLFGPYASTRHAKATVQMIEQAIPLRTCSDAELAARVRPCLLYKAGRCVAPCVPHTGGRERYAELVQQARRTLEMDEDALLAWLDAAMQEAAEALAFERAGRLRDLRATVARARLRLEELARYEALQQGEINE